MKTFAECRNEIANKEGHADWLTLVYRENLTSIQLLSEQAAILFAKEFSDEQLKEQLASVKTKRQRKLDPA